MNNTDRVNPQPVRDDFHAQLAVERALATQLAKRVKGANMKELIRMRKTLDAGLYAYERALQIAAENILTGDNRSLTSDDILE